MEAFIGSIILFAGNFPPRGWAFCQGQILGIAQNSALFAILGTNYGGNGTQTFGLPDLRSRVPVGQGQGPGLSNVSLGEVSGTETVTLLAAQMPTHNHALIGGGSATQVSPVGNFSGEDPNGSTQIYASTPAGPMNAAAITLAGGSQPFSIMQPFLGLNYIICLEGIFPSRN